MNVWFRGERNVKWRMKVSKSNNVNVPETRYFCILVYDTVWIGRYVPACGKRKLLQSSQFEL